MAVSARTARILATELAAAAVLAAALLGPVAAAIAATVASVVIGALWARPRGRHTHEWLGIALRHHRARPPAVLTEPLPTVPIPPPPSRLPHDEPHDDPHDDPRDHRPDGAGITAIDDEHGLTVVLELGDPDALIAPEPAPLPHPAEFPAAHAHIQLVVAIEPARVAGYRATTGVPARVRALLAVRVPHRTGRDPVRDLHGALRTVRAVLGDLPHRPLGGAELATTLRDLAGTAAGPHRQTWRHLRTPDQVQAVFRILGDRPPVADLARLDAVRVTLALTPADTLLHVTVPAEAHPGLPRVPHAHRLDGEHLAALTAVLPLARNPHGSTPQNPHGSTRRSTHRSPHESPPAKKPIRLPRDGVFLGHNREGDPVVIRPFRRSGPVTIAVVGDVRGARLVTLRAVGSGAVALIRSTRPATWFSLLEPVSKWGPVLEVLDHRPGSDPYPHARLLVLDELTPESAAVAASADLVLLQAVPAVHAEIAERVLGLGRAAGWLTRIRPGMFAVVAGRALRWVEPSPSDAEKRALDRAAE
ncbi:type VII secretion protein EccE [Catenuloplanes nepalensis]|uniref:Type VII secretion protein EccE n=1 Tax=Catenuloplanes nepalensis TaxID=587533 RepID=A0ABT9N6L9_9ACTN|nr:hypothetical protein [Catenuloplanes nepalensis]MDP9798891.1 type VII secretion protein EccE [Catenuloplanes nepalensis]